MNRMLRPARLLVLISSMFVAVFVNAQTTYYVNDNSTAADVFTGAVGNNANAGTAIAPFATLQYAVTTAVANDIIYVDAGSYTEQVIINKGITIIGAGQNLTLFTPPATTLVPAPGPFTEIGLFVTTQGIGDVHIRNLSINSNGGSQNIIIQSGGSVKNCTLLNGGQGIFFRVESAVKTALIENNFIQPQGIGINCQGSGMTATIINNTITNPAGFYAAIFGGLDFGPLPQLTINNNLLTNTGFFGIGMEVNSYNGNYNLNSIVGFPLAIRTYNTGNTPNATCNWYGTITAGTIAGMISGSINYIPYITIGTDNSSSNGFQPVNAACSGRNVYYVNDNSLSADVFTTAIGSNSNNGSASAPFATISYALTQAAADDYIYIDAGTYTEQVTTDKGITIIGAGQNLTSILKPAITSAPPGSFIEQGVIQTAQSIIGDVHISNLSVTGDYTAGVTPIIIQTGGSVKNCKLQNGNQGIFVRIDPSINLATKTFVVDANTINAEYIAVNFAGTRLTGILTNNVLATFNPSFSTGVFAGLDFGTLAGLTVTGNTFSSFVSDGLLVNTNNGTISQNSFLGTGPKAINKIGGSTINATCNWYGSADVNVVALKITPGVTFSPWLVSGTDNSSAIGFQPVPGTCTGRQNKFYVNDNSTANDVFTTAVGTDNNPGVPSAPLATITTAIARASAGDTIFVDAGTFAPGIFTIDKAITILGTNYLITPNNPSDKLVYNTSRNAESTISNSTITFAADNINIEGLRFNTPATTQFILSSIAVANDLCRNIKLSKNRFVSTTTAFTLFSFLGKAGTLVTGGYIIDDNRMEEGAGAYMRLSNLTDVTITNNSLIRSAVPVQGGTVAIRPQGPITNLVAENNTIQNWDVTLIQGGAPIKNLVYNNNNLISCQRCILLTSTDTESGTLTITNNNITQHSTAFAPVISIVRSTALNAVSPNFITIENNSITKVAAAQTTTLFPLIDLTCNNSSSTGDPLSSNYQVSIKRNKLLYSGDMSTAITANPYGIQLSGKMAISSIENNELTFSGTNLLSPAANSLLRPTGIFFNNSSGIPTGATINIFNNKVQGFKHSVAFYNGTQYGSLASGISANINNNSFTGDSISINNGTVSQQVLATCNWYGSNSEENINAKLSLATVQHIPWLTNGTDNDAATGFQPVPNSCNGYPRKLYVNDGSYFPGIDVFTTAIGSNANPGTAAAPFATLDFAYSVAEQGDTIYVDAGSYTMANLLLDKSVTILGSNYTISPNLPSDKYLVNTGRNAETIISQAAFFVAANNITVSGLRFMPTTTAVSVTVNVQNLKVTKNYFDNAGTATALFLQGVGTAPFALKDVEITDNRFEKFDGITGGTGLFISAVASTAIVNNAFVETGANQRRSNGIFSSSTNSIDNCQFTDNYFKNNNFSLRLFSCTNVDVLNNKLDSVGRGIQFFYGFSPTDNINITGNTITNTRTTQPILFRRSSVNAGVSNINISGNTINHGVENYVGLAGMIQLQFGTTEVNGQVNVLNNKINIYGDYTTSSVGANPAIFIVGNHQHTIISGNELNFSAINARTGSGFNLLPEIPTGIYFNTDGGVNSGALPSSAVFTVENNKINGFKNSIAFYDPTATGLTPVVGYGYLTNGTIVNINNNSFTNDSMSIDNGTNSQSVIANCNWYGSAAAQNFINKLTLSTVNIVPWLTNGADNDVATGFQPVPNTCDGYPTLITLNDTTNVTCNGAANGTIDITTSYGKAPFVYTWTKDGDANFVSNNEDLTGLAPGTYRLAITDGNGSNIYIIDENADGPGTIVVTITEPDVLSASASGDNNICFNGTIGSAAVVAEGGTAPYTYLWSNGATTDEITNLSAGIYSITVTDANGCTTIASYEVTQPTQVILSITNGSTACSNIATVNTSGGTPGYTYLWSNGSTLPTISGVPVGTYSVTVTDANGCTAISSVILSVGEAFNPSASVTDITCFGANNGIITITNVNGTAPFMFSKDGGVSFVNGSLPFSFSNLAPGIYNIAVKDENGCTGFVEKTVTQPTQLTTAHTVQNTCAGLSTGSINVTVSGGSPAYSYSWTGLNGTYSSTQLNISNLAAGNYTLTVTDKNNCTVVVPVTVNPFPAIVIARTIIDVACRGGATGSINITATGGTGSGFTYSWTGAVISSSEDLTNIAKGTYKLRVTDNGSGCIVDSTFTVNEPASSLALATVKTNATGCSSLGSITGTGSGGTAPYTYNLNGGIYSSIGLFTGLYAGSYTIGILDAKGCTTTKVVAITDNGADEYEGTGPNKNNTRTRAFSITIETNIYARIPTVADSLDWYKFTTAAIGNYTVTFSHPNPAIVFDVYSSTGTMPMAPVTGSTPTAKTYSLTGGTLYYIKVFGALSYICYDLKVSYGGAARINNSQAPANETGNTIKPVITAEVLKAATYPNPHQGSFAISIESPEQGIAMIELFAANGQLISERKVHVLKGKGNIVQYNNMHQTVLYYRVRIGKHIVTGKIIGPN